MKVIVFGATGPTGQLVVREALARGHDVTAFVHTAPLDLRHEHLRVVHGDVLDTGLVEGAMAGQEAVVCALGTHRGDPDNVHSAGTMNIVEAMKRVGARRLVVLSAAGVLGSDTGIIAGRILIPVFLGRMYADKREQLKVVQESGLDWVVVRPARLTKGPKTGRCAVTFDRPAKGSIPRADVALFMVDQIESNEHLGAMPIISRL